MSNNCPYCPPDFWAESWLLSPEGWAECKKRHNAEHSIPEQPEEKKTEAEIRLDERKKIIEEIEKMGRRLATLDYNAALNDVLEFLASLNSQEK